MNHKRLYGLYLEQGLAVRRRKRQRVAVPRQPMATLVVTRVRKPQQWWS